MTPSAEIAVAAGLEGRLAEAERQDEAPSSRWLAELAAELESALERLAGEVAIERRADWLVLASRLVLLRSRVAWLEEDTPPAAAPPTVVASSLPAAAWLEARPMLGQDVFARPQRAEPRSHSYFGLMQACLDLLRAPVGTVAPAAEPRPVLWRVADALGRIRALGEQHAAGAPLATFYPPEARHGVAARAVVASTLLAALELTRDGSVSLDQGQAFGEISVLPSKV